MVVLLHGAVGSDDLCGVAALRAALLAVDWDIREVIGGDKVLAEEQASVLREAYDRIDNFREAVSFLFTGFFRGFAHVEKHYGRSGLVERLEPVEQWFWVRDGMFGERSTRALRRR